jgi:hypothetical protein
MARVRSTARVERDGDETEAAETVPISDAMRRSGLVSSEDTPDAEATQADVEEVGSEDEYSCGMPSKPSHLDFGKSTISEADCNTLNLGVEFFFFFSLTKFRRYPFLFPFLLAKP